MITVKDEELHAPGGSPRWQESYYFNWSTADGRSFGLTRIGLNHASGKADAVVVILRDGDPELVYAAVGEPIPSGVLETSLSDGLTVGRLTYTMVDPLGSWQIALVGRDRLDLSWSAYTPPADFHDSFPGDHEGLQRHFEQSGRVSGEVTCRGRTTRVDGLGQRDKSWGVRDWAGIKGWEWIAGQFDETLSFNATLTDVDGVTSPAGFVYDGGVVRLVRTVAIDYTGGHLPEAVRIRIRTSGDRSYVVHGTARGRIPLYKEGLLIEETQFEFTCEVNGVRRVGAGVVEHAYHVGLPALLPKVPRLLKVLRQARRDSR